MLLTVDVPDTVEDVLTVVVWDAVVETVEEGECVDETVLVWEPDVVGVEDHV